MTIYEALETDHREVKAMLAKLIELPEGKTDSYKTMISQLENELRSHHY